MRKTGLWTLTLLVAGGLFWTSSAQAVDATPDTVMKVLKANKDLSKFTSLVESSGMEAELSKADGKITIFAPSNAALEKAPEGLLKRAKDGKDGTKQLVGHHIIMGSVVYSGNIKGRRASPSTANGDMIGFDGMGKDLKVGEGTITGPDQKAKNGVVHTVSAVLVPDSLRDPKEKEAERAAEEKKMKEEMDARMKEREDRQKEMEAKMAKDKPAAAKPEAKTDADAPKTDDAKPEASAPAPAAAPAPAKDKAAPKSDAAASTATGTESKSGWKKMFGF